MALKGSRAMETLAPGERTARKTERNYMRQKKRGKKGERERGGKREQERERGRDEEGASHRAYVR